MSGDVQPRKRKDKRRKRDDATEETVPVQKPPVPSQPDPETNIHVHKERSTGGGICAKLVFFALFAALVTVIGFTITEYRGFTDLDIVDSDSRFAQIFAGWIDTSPAHDEHEDAFDASPEEEEEEEEVVASDEEQLEASEEEDAASEEEENEQSNEEEEEYQNEQEEEEEPDDDEEEEQDTADTSDETPDEDDDDEEEAEEEENVNEDEDNEEIVNETETGNIETAKVAVKIGVGLSILVVAYVVLVKKWKSDPTIKPEKTSELEEMAPDLTRRNTIVQPPSLEEVEPDMENAEEDYSEEEAEESEEEPSHRPSLAKMKYRDLQYTYSRSLTPDGEPRRDRREEDDDEDYAEDSEEEDVEEEDDVPSDEDDDDDELMKKLDEKYGRLSAKHEVEEEDGYDSWKCERESDNEESYSEDEKKTSGAQNVTETVDWFLNEELERAEADLPNNAALALTRFESILEKHPNTPRALFGKARSLDVIAEKKRSNKILQDAIDHYQRVLSHPSTPDVLFRTAAERCLNRMHFLGKYLQALTIHKRLIEKFPDESSYRNQLAVAYLTLNKVREAKKVLGEVLKRWPENGVALVHHGFILKTNENKLEEAVKYLRMGLATGEAGVVDGRFYFHLGDALSRLGRPQEASEVHKKAALLKLFLSEHQRSLYNVPRLKGQPWWDPSKTPYSTFFSNLEKNYLDILAEGTALLSKTGFFVAESENLRDTGDWKQLELFARGIKHRKNCEKCPKTCALIEAFPDASGCRRGQVKFSVMHPGTHVWPHCGPTNCRLRAHLGLKVPAGTAIRVAEETRSWTEGKVILFDDSFEHEVWHNGSDLRLVLIVDVWHPELTAFERGNLTPI